MTDHTGVLYAKNEIELSWLIGQGPISNKNENTMTWSIVQVRFKLRMKLNYLDRLGRVWSMMKMAWDNNMTNCIGVIYAKNES